MITFESPPGLYICPNHDHAYELNASVPSIWGPSLFESLTSNFFGLPLLYVPHPKGRKEGKVYYRHSPKTEQLLKNQEGSKIWNIQKFGRINVQKHRPCRSLIAVVPMESITVDEYYVIITLHARLIGNSLVRQRSVVQIESGVGQGTLIH